MAARFRTTTYTLTGSAVSLSTIFNDPFIEYAQSITMRAGKTNAGDIDIQDDASSPGGYLEPKEAVEFDLSGAFVKLSEIYINGTSGDTIEITVIG